MPVLKDKGKRKNMLSKFYHSEVVFILFPQRSTSPCYFPLAGINLSVPRVCTAPNVTDRSICKAPDWRFREPRFESWYGLSLFCPSCDICIQCHVFSTFSQMEHLWSVMYKVYKAKTYCYYYTVIYCGFFYSFHP